jgi:hypothetical protein
MAEFEITFQFTCNEFDICFLSKEVPPRFGSENHARIKYSQHAFP